MASSSAADCNCETACPGADHCICMFVHGAHGGCVTDCSGGGTITIEIGPPVIKKLELDESVNLDVRNADPVQVATRLSEHVAEELYIPVSRAREKLTFRQEYVSLRVALEYAGIVIGDPRETSTPAAE